MSRDPGPSWQVHLFDHEQVLELALWVRDAEGIDVPAGGVVPGPVDRRPFPAAASVGARSGDVATAWRAWWDLLLTVPGTGARAREELWPPGLAVLDPWPDLQELARRRAPEALDWSRARKRPEVVEQRWRRAGPVTQQVVADAVAAAGRPVRPFRLDLLVVPVLEDEIRDVAPGRHVVPERVVDGPDWAARLSALVRPLA